MGHIKKYLAPKNMISNYIYNDRPLAKVEIHTTADHFAFVKPTSQQLPIENRYYSLRQNIALY